MTQPVEYIVGLRLQEKKTSDQARSLARFEIIDVGVKRSSISGDDSGGCIGMLGVVCALITLEETREQHTDILR